MVRATTFEKFQFFLWYNSTMLAKWMIYPTDWSAPPTPLEVSGSSPSEDSASSVSSALCPSLLQAATFHHSWLGSKGMTVLQLPGGKQVPWCLRTSYIWSPSWGAFGSRGSLPIFPISRLLGAGQSIWQDVHHTPYGPTFTGIWDSGPCISNPASSPLHSSTFSYWILPRYSNWSIWTCCDKCTPNSATFLPSLLEGIKLLSQSVQCHYHAMS